MKTLIVATTLALLATAASAAPCRMQAASQKLTGEAYRGFMQRCEQMARQQCQQTSMQRYPMAGAGRNAFMERCVLEAVGG